jgi:ribosomal protein S8
MKKINKNDSKIIFKLAKLLAQKGYIKKKLWCERTRIKIELIQGFITMEQ